MWSLGCVIYFMITGNKPFKNKNIAKLHQNIINGTFNTKCEEYFKVSSSCKNLIQSLIHIDPETRLSASDALNH